MKDVQVKLILSLCLVIPLRLPTHMYIFYDNSNALVFYTTWEMDSNFTYFCSYSLLCNPAPSFSSLCGPHGAPLHVSLHNHLFYPAFLGRSFCARVSIHQHYLRGSTNCSLLIIDLSTDIHLGGNVNLIIFIGLSYQIQDDFFMIPPLYRRLWWFHF